MVDNCEILMSRDADLTKLCPGDYNLLYLAAKRNCSPALKRLSEHIVGNASGFEEPSRICFTSTKGKSDIVNGQVTYGIDTETLRYGRTALFMAASEGHKSCVELLLAAGADPSRQDLWGTNPLLIASEHGHLEIVKLLLPVTRNLGDQDGDGDTAMSNAAASGYVSIVELLMDSGCEVVPQEPGPHSTFLDKNERKLGYAKDAILRAWEHGQEETTRALLLRFANRDPHSEYATALKALETESQQESFRTWIDAPCTAAPENRMDLEAFREEVSQRYWREYEERRSQMIDQELATRSKGGNLV